MTQAQGSLNFAFLHGGGQGSWVWDGVIESLRRRAPGVSALALDVPGCGVKRGRDTTGLSIPEVVAELAAEIDACSARDLVLVGHSQAGTVLPSLLAARPAAFRRAVYVSCCAPAPGQTVRAMMGNSRRGENPDELGWPVDRATASFDGFARAMFCNDMDEAQAAEFLARLGEDAWPDACALAYDRWTYGGAGAPATYVVLEQDASLPVEWQLRFAARLGAERLVRIDSGHQVMQTAPDALAQALLTEAAL